MPAVTQIVHSNRFYPLQNGLAQFRYVGLKFPESQWAGLLEEAPRHVTRLREIGHISVMAEGTGEFYDIERQLLSMAKLHGAHMVLIDFFKCFEKKNPTADQACNRIHIYGRCQRFEL